MLDNRLNVKNVGSWLTLSLSSNKVNFSKVNNNNTSMFNIVISISLG